MVIFKVVFSRYFNAKQLAISYFKDVDLYCYKDSGHQYITLAGLAMIGNYHAHQKSSEHDSLKFNVLVV